MSSISEFARLDAERNAAQAERRRVLFAPIATPSLAARTHGFSLAAAGGLSAEKVTEYMWKRSRSTWLAPGGYHRRPLPRDY